MKRTAALTLAILAISALIACSAPVADGRSDSSGLPESVAALEPISFDELGIDADSPAGKVYSTATVYRVLPVSDSQDLLSEAQVAEEAAARGFTEVIPTTTYDVQGNYRYEEAVDPTSDEKHPTYMTGYTTSSGDAWIIYISEDLLTAAPFILNGEFQQEQYLLSERDYVVSYDSDTNAFYAVVADPEEMTLITVDRIDAETLDSFDFEAYTS